LAKRGRRSKLTTTPGAELQTLEATVGSTIGGDTLKLLPTVQRNVTGLLLLQATSMPQQGGVNQSSYYGGQVAGAKSDQNSIVLDGGNVTCAVSGNSDYYTNYTGGQEAAIPTPVESIQEFGRSWSPSAAAASFTVRCTNTCRMTS
jgi:hypothetical protein